MIDIQTVIEGVLLTLIILILRYYLPSYINKKAENLAQKEDISEITTQIEKIKHEFDKRNEEIRSDLAIVANRKIEFNNLTRDSVLKFNEALSTWYHVGLDLMNVSYMVDPEEIKAKLIQINQYSSDVWRAQSNILMIIGYGNFSSETTKVMGSILPYSHFIQEYLLKYYHRLQIKDALNKQINSTAGLLPDNRDRLELQVKNAWDEINNKYTEFGSAQNEKARVAYAAKMEFEKACNKYLNENAA